MYHTYFYYAAMPVIRTPQELLFDACVEGNLGKFEIALDNGADINHVIDTPEMAYRFGPMGNNPLLVISMHDGTAGHEDIFNYILSHPSVDPSYMSDQGRSAIVNSVYIERTDRVFRVELELEDRAAKVAKRTQKNKLTAYVHR